MKGQQLTLDAVVHIIMPDMATLCRDDYLEASDRGDRCAISVPGDRWAGITCPWCRSLGRSYYGHVCRTMQGRAAA